jgi:glycosyltransferase involved in cell wall biosynthesis
MPFRSRTCYVLAVARRPTFAESAEKPRVLVCAFAEVPGHTAASVRAEQLLLGFSQRADVDALSLKSKHLAHIQRVGAARMLRVPVPELRSGEVGALGVSFLERLSVYRRALTRQLDNEHYDLVYALDLWSAAAAVRPLGGGRLVVDVADLPSRSWDARWLINPVDATTRAEWAQAERAALKAAALIVAPSRQAARIASESVDPRAIHIFPRVVDTRPFAPPTVELDLEDARTVAFLGGREGGGRTALLTSALKLLTARAAESRLLVVGGPGRGDVTIQAALQHRALAGRTALVDVATPAELQAAISTADVVVVIADATSVAVPHRVLEAMACGRAVVLAAPESACRDAVVPGQHVVVVPPDAPERIAETVCDLLDDTGLRGRLGKAAKKHAATLDLALRLPELALAVRAATGVVLDAHLGPLEDAATLPAPVAAPLPPPPPSPPSPPSSPPSSNTTSLTTSLTLRSELLSLPEVSAELVGAPADGVAIGDAIADSTLDNGRLPSVSTMASREASRGIAEGPSSVDVGDVWARDTTVESEGMVGSAEHRPSPAPAVVMTMVEPQEPASDAPTVHTTDAAAVAQRPGITPGVRSMLVDSQPDRAGDEWSQDTIADASPLPEVSLSIAEPRVEQRRSALPRSLLVTHRFSDQTAEDESEA